MRNRSLFTSIAWPAARRPARADILERLDCVVPWDALAGLIAQPTPGPRGGRPSHPRMLLLRIWVLQQLYRVSDEAAESLILDSHSAAAFVGLDPWKPRPPGASAIGNFRRAIASTAEGRQLQRQLDDAMQCAGLELRPGCLVEPVLRNRGPS
ncbi:transposase [Chitinivorax sp. PXF-14]|uniref:transposase n=1 Tax=Chitinivorax sp. PXF-14 TaxID=3230488 RepID=UPI003465AD33